MVTHISSMSISRYSHEYKGFCVYKYEENDYNIGAHASLV